MKLKRRSWRWLIGVAALAMAEGAVVLAIEVAVTTSAEAQYRDDRYPRRQRQRSGGFFEELFGGHDTRAPVRDDDIPQPQPQVDYSRAPPPRKSDKAEQTVPATSVVVLGDSMADWLGYGLEEAFADAPDIAVVRKEKARSGLIRYQVRSDLDWWHVARDILAQEKANYVVMMLGVADRQNIRERDVAQDAEQEQAEQAAQNAQSADKPEGQDQASIAAPEPKEQKPDPKAKKPTGVIEFRSDRWAEVYSKRIDETIAAMKSKGVPVFWVGLPPIRGTKSTADAGYLNDLYRARAERAGAVYIDVWDGFVDEGGKFTTFGPDYEGQTRRLRSGDGVYFTKYGARKLAHYVEREIRRYMNNRALPVALPTGPLSPVPGDGKSTERPLAGPVVPLTVTVGNAEVLAGGPGHQAALNDQLATQVLVKGEPMAPPPGRADDFAWPPGSNQRVSAPAAAPPPAAAQAPSAPAVVPVAKPAVATPAVAPQPAAPSVAAPAQPKPQAVTPPPQTRPRPVQPAERPRPPQNIQQPPQRRSTGLFDANGPLGWMR